MKLLAAIFLVMLLPSQTVTSYIIYRGFSYPPEMLNSGGWLKNPHIEKRLK